MHFLTSRANTQRKHDALKVVDCLESYGLNLNSANRYGETPLLGAACYRFDVFPELCERLLQLGACPSVLDERGLNFVSYVRIKFKNKQLTMDAFNLVNQFGFDYECLNKDDVRMLTQRYIKRQIFISNVTKFNVFAKTCNRVSARPFKVKKAQNMMRGMFAEVSAYLNNDFK